MSNVIFRPGADIFETEADVLVNPVNCRGIMGAGLAWQFKRRYPEMYRAYRRACDAGEVALGRVWWHVAGREPPLAVACLPTKDHWRDPGDLEAVRDGLKALAADLDDAEGLVVAVPKLGCGLGGLDWRQVRPLVLDAAATRPDVAWIVLGEDAADNEKEAHDESLSG